MLSRLVAVFSGVGLDREDRDDPLQKEIVHQRELLAACPPGHPQRAVVCASLVNFLHQRFDETGKTALLEEVITLGREALALQPVGHPGRASAYNNLAIALQKSFDRTGNNDFLDEAITMQREALALLPAGHPGRSALCNNLANALRKCYRMTGSSDRLDEAITLQREALTLQPARNPVRASLCINLASILHTSYEMTGSSDRLDETITLQHEALALLPAEHPLRASLCNSLAIILQRSYNTTGSSELLDEAITLQREALSLRSTGHPDRASSCNSLAIVLQKRYKMTGSSNLLDESIALHREALALRPPGHQDRSVTCNNLANALETIYEMTGSRDVLDEAITLHREALALRPAGHPLRASACLGLANTLQKIYGMTGSRDVLDEAIALQREALALQPAGHPDRFMSCSNLAITLQTSYNMTGSSGLIDEVITLQREALALQPAGHPYRASSCNNLATALQTRYNMTGSSDLLDDVIALQREALSLRPTGHALHASSCSNLANTLDTIYEMTGNRDVLGEAITLHRAALALRPAGHPDRAGSCINLASTLHNSYETTGSSDLRDEAITLQREALALQPAEHPDRASSCHNLASYLWRRYTATHDVKDIDEALALARESAASRSPSSSWRSLHILCRIHIYSESPRLSISAAAQYLLQASAMHPDNVGLFITEMQPHLALIWFKHNDWTADIASVLLNVYSNLIDMLTRLTGFALDTTSQLTGLKSARSFGSDACMAALLSGRSSQAIEQIDHAQGVIWAQALHQRDPQLEDLPGHLASELETLLRVVSVPTLTVALIPSNPATGYLSPEDVRHQQNSRIQTILTEVRAMPGLERFMLGNTYAQLRATAREHPVVVLVSAHGLVYALIIRNSIQEHPDEIRLRISSNRLLLLRDTAARAGLRNVNAMRDIGIESERSMRPGNFEDTPLGMLASLWREIVKPVIDHLQLSRAMGRARPRLHWCPTGDFTFLPIHAAGIYAGPEDSHVCCSDYVVSSYTPTLSALLNAQNKAPQTAPSHLNILAVAEDGRGPGSTVSPLFGVGPELTCVLDTAKASGHDCSVDLIPKQATVDGVAERMQTAHFVHLACHGTQDETSALESGFYLSNGMLRVSKLMHLNLDKAWLAYLSACETAKSDTNQPDQVVYLTAAMLHAGFKSVVATMWSMADDDGPIMAQWFYEDLLSNEVIDADAVAYALDAAVEKLRAKMPLAPKRWAPYIHMGA